MINTQLAFLTASALSNLDSDVDLDKLVSDFNVDDELISKAESFAQNHNVRVKNLGNISQIVSHVRTGGIEIATLYANAIGADAPKINISTSTISVSKGVSVKCHGNCHSNCHGSRGWR